MIRVAGTAPAWRIASATETVLKEIAAETALTAGQRNRVQALVILCDQYDWKTTRVSDFCRYALSRQHLVVRIPEALDRLVTSDAIL